MQRVSTLKGRGFTVRPAANAVGCTEVRFNTEFHYFNPTFLDDASNLAGSLKAAELADDGQYGIIVAGVYGESDSFPFVLLSANQVREVRNAHSLFVEARTQRDEAIKRVGKTGAALADLLEALVA